VNSESVQCNFVIFDHVTFIQFKICCCVQNFMQNRMAIYRFSKWWPSAILKLFYQHTRPPIKSLLLAAAACQISCQSDTQIWRYSYLIFFCIFGLKRLFRPQNGSFGDFGSVNVIIHHRVSPKGTSLRKSASFKLSTVKIRWGVWPVGELTESVTDTHTYTHRGKFIFCPCIALDRQLTSKVIRWLNCEAMASVVC